MIFLKALNLVTPRLLLAGVVLAVLAALAWNVHSRIQYLEQDLAKVTQQRDAARTSFLLCQSTLAEADDRAQTAATAVQDKTREWRDAYEKLAAKPPVKPLPVAKDQTLTGREVMDWLIDNLARKEAQ